MRIHRLVKLLRSATKNSAARARPDMLLAGFVGIVLFTVQANAHTPPGCNTRVAVNLQGGAPSAPAAIPSTTPDGAFIAYQTQSHDIVEGDTNLGLDIFVRDMIGGGSERVSLASNGTQGNDQSYDPSISGDGRFVAFTSFASNLVPLDTNTQRDVFVHDRMTGTTRRVSVATDGAQGNALSVAAALSRDGRYVAFQSDASNLVLGDTNNATDVFVHDLQTGVTERVSVGPGGVQGNGHSYRPSLSADGRLVVYSSAASNLVAGDSNDEFDLFAYDRQTGVTERLDVATSGTQANAGIPNPAEARPAVTPDGRYVAFFSNATNLVPSDANGENVDVFVRDRVLGVTERVSVPSVGSETIFGSVSGVPLGISDDGRFVTFSSVDALSADDTNNLYDHYVVDRVTGQAEAVAVTDDGASGTANSWGGVIDASGRYPVFGTYSLNMDNLPPPPGFPWQFYLSLFQRDRGPEVGIARMTMSVMGCEVEVQGTARYGGVVLAEATDPTDDGGAGAGELGAELTGASVIYRPEVGDLFARLRLTAIPVVAGGAGAPGVVYVLAFQVDGMGYEARGTKGNPGTSDQFTLFRCEPETGCSEVASLEGGIGTSGHEVRFAMPLETVGATASILTNIEVSTGTGDVTTGIVSTLDQVGIASSVIPEVHVVAGFATPGTPESEVQFNVTASTSAGAFFVELGVLPSGTWDVWTRACVGNRCGAASVPVTCIEVDVSGDDRPAQLTLRRDTPNPFRSATSLSYTLPVPGRVSVRIVNVQGRLVEKLVQAWQPAGEHRVEWDARDQPAGLYIAIVASGGVTRKEKLVLIH